MQVVLTSGYRQHFRVIAVLYTEALAQGTSHASFWHLLAVVLVLGPAASTKELSQEFLQVELLIMMPTPASAVVVVGAVL